MSSPDLPTPLTRQAIAVRDRSAPLEVTGRLRKALDLMVWEGQKRDDAAIAARLTVHGIREALRKPHVKAYYLQQLEVLRTSERARNIHALVAVRDRATNQAAVVHSVRTLEQMADDGARERPAAPFAGLVVQIVTAAPAAPEPRVIEAKEAD
jgi:hypothetical protein